MTRRRYTSVNAPCSYPTHDLIVESLLDQCKHVIEHILQAPDLHSVASASLALFAQMREVAREILQTKITLETQQLKSQDIAPCCQNARMIHVHNRTVSPQTLFGEVCIRVRTFQYSRCGATRRPDDHHLGVPEARDFTDDVRFLYAPVVAELPQRVANDLFPQCTGVPLSARGAQGILDHTAEDLRTWQVECEGQEAAAVAGARVSDTDVSGLRLELAMDGVMAHIDGRWQEVKVATILVRQPETPAEEPTLGAVLARRYVGILGAPEELAARIKRVLREAGWERIPLGEMLGDGAPWIWTVAATHFPGVRQTLDYYHLSEHLYAVAHLQPPNNPAGGQGLGGPENRCAAQGPGRGGPQGAQTDTTVEKAPPRRPHPADRLCRAQPHTYQVPGALAVWAGHRVRRGGGRVQACDSKSLQASGHALETARLSQRPSIAARQTQWDISGPLGTSRACGPVRGMTYRMKAHPSEPVRSAFAS